MPFAEGYIKLIKKANQIVDSVKYSNFLGVKKENGLPYAYPCDNYIEAIFSNGLIRKSFQNFSEKYCKKQILHIQSTGQLVAKANFPRLFDILAKSYKELNVSEIPEVYITNQLKGINALSIGTDNSPIILISHKSIVCLSDNELKFMIGHELGHILQKNLMCHTIKGLLDNLNNKSEILGPIVSDIIEIPLNQWFRCAEYTADRAGYLCCKDIKSIETLLHKTIERKSKVGLNDFMELYQCHPLIKTRIDRITEFAKSYII